MSNILIVEDDPCTQRLFSTVLNKSGHTPVAAHSFDGALQKLGNNDFELIITDIMLGDNSGIDLLQEVFSRGLSTPVIVVTSSPTLDTAIRSIQLGAFDYLCKPVGKKPLLDVTRRALAHKKTRDAEAEEKQHARQESQKLLSLVLSRTAELAQTNCQLGRELSSRAQTEKKLASSESMARSMLNATDDFAVLVDMDACILFCNEAFANYVNARPEDLKGQLLTVFMPPDAARTRIHIVKDAVSTGKSVKFSDISRGKYFDHSVYPMFDAAGNVTSLAVFTRDITANRKLERELNQTRERLTLAFEATNDGLWDWETASNAVYVSPRWAEILGYHHDELSLDFQAWKAMVHPQDAENILHTLSHMQKCNGPTNTETEMRVRTKEGRWKWMLARFMIASRDQECKPLRIVGAFMDITSRKKMEKKLRQAKNDAEAASNAKTSFLAAMSHEFKTPLHHIYSLTDLVADEISSEEHRENLELVKQSVNSLNKLIDQALEFSRIESGEQTLQEVPFELEPLLTDTAATWKEKAAAKKLQFSLNLDPTSPDRLAGDPQALARVFDILLDNALKFTTEGAVSLSSQTLHSEMSKDDYVEMLFSVEDTGIGISETQQELIFDVYTQSEMALHRRFGGVGLGLATARRLVERMNGRIWVESRPGHGARFLFRMPFNTNRCLLEAQYPYDNMENCSKT